MSNYKNVANYKPSASGANTLIEDYKSSGTASTKTFTFTADDFTNTMEYVLYIQGAVTASLELRCQFNGLSAGSYRYDGRNIGGGTETLIDENAGTYLVIDTFGETFHGIIRFRFIRAGPKMQIHVDMDGDATNGTTILSCQYAAGGVTNLSSIKIFTSTSTWKDETHMRLYKVG